MGRFKGQAAEADACHYLTTQGLTLLEKNYRRACGEIDLIMQDKDIVVFVEVRMRQYNYFGSPIESVGRAKQLKLIKTAELYLQQKKLLYKVNFRFDIIGLNASNQIEWLRNAFSIPY
ncbi:MAG TPA: YraN family protein [Gammaproteobacteria bacterium]|nr:YraN family protein [Gammaproteobacteria bacterium]